MRALLSAIGIFLFSILQLQGQPPSDARIQLDEYVGKWKDVAVRQMHQHGIPASITLAQGILESGFGNSPLARYGNNHFGIKCHGWDGQKFFKDDDREDECFRKYHDASRSYADHADFLTSRDRYAFLFDLRVTDYEGWAKGLKKAGYATNPKYPERLIELIESHDLDRFDTITPMKQRSPQVAEDGNEEMENARMKKGRKVFEHPNGIDLIRVQEGDSYERVAELYDIRKERLLEYNDMNPTDRLSPGDTLYLQPKRNWSRKEKKHVAQEGETMWEIAHRYGLKLEKLYERNRMIPGTNPEKGQVIYLRGKRSKDGGKEGFFARLFGSGD